MACINAVACAAGEMTGAMQPAQEAAAQVGADDEVRIRAAISKGVALLLAMQEGEPRAEWPYEGVYRVEGQIPIGYRVGGTAIVAMALIEAPGYESDVERLAAVRRAIQFIIGALDHPLMGPEVEARYDVRGWGYTYALQLVLMLIDRRQVPEDLSNACTDAVRILIDRINATEIVETGGWNYSRRAGFDKPSPSSAFMTAPTLQALFMARQQGFAVDPEVISRGIEALERGRMESGAFAYVGVGAKARDGLPGAIGRTVAAETTLFLCGRSSQDRLRAAVNAFFEHWNELEKRRAQPGTHAAPFGVAPYYFFYAHYFAAQAIEQL
ncbi:MAG: hypothetical protein L0Y44_16615, partial [Phycisphaerales bacterium]|nr:hypothetical protein [Phycisphaerales bacterium]